MAENRPFWLYLHAYFRQPEEGGALRSWFLAQEAQRQGYRVRVITRHNARTRKLWQDPETGLEVLYLPVPYPRRGGLRAKAMSFLRFFLYAWWEMLQSPELPQRVYASSTPLTVGLLAALYKRVRGVPFTWEVRDLWPWVPDAMGYLPAWARPWAYALERWIWHQADSGVVLSPAMARYLHEKNLTPQSLLVLPNFAPQVLTEMPEKVSSPIRIGYKGSLGPSHGVEAFVRLAQIAHENFPGTFQFLGFSEDPIPEAWQSVPGLRWQAGTQPKDYLLCHWAYVSYAPIPALWTGSPNKYFEALGLGLPVLLNFLGDWGQEVEAQRVGLVYTPQQSEEALLRQLVSLHQTGDYPAWARSAWRYGQSQYSPAGACQRWAEFIRKLPC